MRVKNHWFLKSGWKELPSNEKGKKKRGEKKRKSMKEKDDEKRGKGEWGAMPPKKMYILNWKEI